MSAFYSLVPSRAVRLACSAALAGFAACADAPSGPMPVSPSLAKAPTNSSYAASFRDSVSDRLRSDGRGTYVDGTSCVTSLGGSAGGGLYQLRSIENILACTSLTRGVWRGFAFDLGVASADLDQDGVQEAVEDAPARMLADKAFAQGATSTPVKILVLEALPSGATTQNTKWTLIYTSNVPVSGTGARTLEAIAGQAQVKIYAGTYGRGSVAVATVDLPFKLTLTQ